MDLIVAHPETEENFEALKSFMQKMKIKFEVTKEYDPEFVAQILQGDEDLKAGKGKIVTIEDLDALWK